MKRLHILLAYEGSIQCYYYCLYIVINLFYCVLNGDVFVLFLSGLPAWRLM